MNEAMNPIYDPVTGVYTMRAARVEKTFTAQIYVGQRVGYGDAIIPITEAETYLHEYCDEVGFCVTITPTKFIYKSSSIDGEPIKGEEPGFIVGIIQYPLYPLPEQELRWRTELIALKLKELYQQKKVSVVYPDMTKTYM